MHLLLANNSASGGGAAPGFESIASATPSGVSTTTFSSIPQTYSALQIRFNCRGSVDWTALRMRINGVSTQSYTYHLLSGDGSSVVATGAGTTGGVQMTIGYSAYLYPSFSMVGIIDFYDYTSTNKNKTIKTFSGVDTNNTIAGECLLQSNLFNSTSAISSIEMFTTSGNFAAGTVIALYGIKAAA